MSGMSDRAFFAPLDRMHAQDDAYDWASERILDRMRDADNEDDAMCCFRCESETDPCQDEMDRVLEDAAQDAADARAEAMAEERYYG